MTSSTSGREVFTVHVGSAGCRIGEQYWQKVCLEHCLGMDGMPQSITAHGRDDAAGNLDVFFRDRRDGTWTPRAIFTDLDWHNIDYLHSKSKISKLFSSERLLAGQHTEGADGTFAGAHYFSGARQIDAFLDAAKKEMEHCDQSPHGIQLMHSLSGGAASGYGALILGKLREEFPRSILVNHVVFPTPEDITATGVYNSLQAMHHLIENTDMVHLYDNNSLTKHSLTLASAAANERSEGKPTMEDANVPMISAIGHLTQNMRFPSGPERWDLRKIATNLMLYPRMHFFSSVLIPHRSPSGGISSGPRAASIVKQLFPSGGLCEDPEESLFPLKAFNKDHRLLSSAMLTSSPSINSCELHAALRDSLYRNLGDHMVPWNPRNCLVGLSDRVIPLLAAPDVPGSVKPSQGTRKQEGDYGCSQFIANSAAIADHWKWLLEMHGKQWRKGKASLHKYLDEGMDELEFIEAESNLADLVAEYEQYNDDFDDEEEESSGSEH